MFQYEISKGVKRPAFLVADGKDVAEIVVFLSANDPPIHDMTGQATHMPHLIVDSALVKAEEREAKAEHSMKAPPPPPPPPPPEVQNQGADVSKRLK